MRAVRMHAHGGPDVLVDEEAPEPQVGPYDVLVQIRAVALNHLDLWVRRGLPRLRVRFPHILGSDIAGVVAATGERVTGVAVGHEVVLAPGVSCGQCGACVAGRDNRCDAYAVLGEHIPGGYAERVAVPRVNVLPKPSGLSFEEAAAVPLVFLTAWNMLVTNARIQMGEVVLVWGAGSGVGSAGLQIAKALGARVIATAGAGWKLERALALGADHVIDHQAQNVYEAVRQLTGRRGVDIVFDHVGAATWDTSVRLLTRGGRLVTCGATTGPEGVTDIRYIYGRQLSIHGTWLGTKHELADVMRLIESGRARPVVHAVLPLADAAEAHRMLERREQFGKIVLTP
ncbi:MAG: zinc-binding dehydrogenase [Armatimonadota bacterium]|nr:zinc-binding dehydrogenase [Armatimonadota bacterium]